MASTILFTNWSEEPFTHTWDKESFTFKPGQEVYLPEYLARHFAKHLANRELLKADKELVIHVGNLGSAVFQEWMNKSLSNPGEETSAVKVEVEELNLNKGNTSKVFCDQCDSRGSKHKKDCPTLKKPDDEEFAGLKEN